MAFGRIEKARKTLGEVVAAKDNLLADTGFEWQTFAVPVVAGSDTDIAPMGIPVVINGDGNFEVYVAQDISAATAYEAVDGTTFKVAILIGGNQGVGFNHEDVTIGTSASTLTALAIGDAAVYYSGVDFGAATAGNITEFKQAMSAQGVRAVAEAVTVDPTYNA